MVSVSNEIWGPKVFLYTSFGAKLCISRDLDPLGKAWAQGSKHMQLRNQTRCH